MLACIEQRSSYKIKKIKSSDGLVHFDTALKCKVFNRLEEIRHLLL
jgi:hypothetical protein